MEYIKFNIDEMYQEVVFCEYREIKEGKKGPFIQRAFPFDRIVEHEPKIAEMVEGEIIGIFYEQKGPTSVNEVQYLDHTETMSEEDIDWSIAFVKKACLEEMYDEILRPPTVDEQVEDFIKEFFENEEEEPLEQKDFLAEFFAELESEDEETSKE